MKSKLGRICFCILFSSVTATACQSQNSIQELSKELDTVMSWNATAYRIGQAWLQRQVPIVYVKQSLAKTQDSLQEELDSNAKNTPSNQQKLVMLHTQKIKFTLTHMESAVERNDQKIVLQSLTILSQQQKDLQQLTTTIKMPK